MTEELKPIPCPFCGFPSYRREVCMAVPANEVLTPLNSCSNLDCPAAQISFTDEEWNTRPSPWNADMSAAPRDGRRLVLRRDTSKRFGNLPAIAWVKIGKWCAHFKDSYEQGWREDIVTGPAVPAIKLSPTHWAYLEDFIPQPPEEGENES